MLSTVIIGSKQYCVSLGHRFRVEKLDHKKGSTWIGEQVLVFIDDKGGVTAGAPFIDKAKVKARIVRHGKAKKMLTLKKKRRKGYRRTQGHRQMFTELLIEALSDSSGHWHELSKKVSVKSADSSKKSKTSVEKAGSKTVSSGKSLASSVKSKTAKDKIKKTAAGKKTISSKVSRKKSSTRTSKKS